jgi:4-amino-4-deoxy-L-arabinose transferase-like glycosyltransferase
MLSNHDKPSKWLEWLLILGLLLAIILPRGLDLSRYVTIDEGLWLYRSANYYYALGQREFEHTYQSEHPGVTTTMAGAVGYYLAFPEYRTMGQGYMPGGKRLVKFLETTDKTPIDLLVAGRKVMIAGTAILLLASYWIVRKMIGLVPAILGFFLIALSPFHVGLTNILHLDGMLTGWMLLSTVAMIFYLFKTRKLVFFLLSAAAGACCLLTKTPGIFMVPFVGLLLLIRYLDEKPYRWKELFTKIAVPLILWVFVAILVFVLLWPAMWVAPASTIQDIVGKMSSYVGGRETLFFDEKTQTTKVMGMDWYPVTLLWRNTPIILIGFILAMVGYALNWGTLGQKITRRFVISFFFFIVFFIITMGLGNLKSDRYILPVYPPLILISALGWVAATEKIHPWFKHKASLRISNYVQAAIFIILVLLQLGETIRTHPYYYTYYNPLMGGPEEAMKHILFGWGEGLNEVAAYLNTKPDADQFTVMLNGYAYGPLSFYLSGTAFSTFAGSPEKINEVDYIVVYIKQIQTGSQTAMILKNTQPEHVVTINDLDYAWIYNVKDISPEDWEKLLVVQE